MAARSEDQLYLVVRAPNGDVREIEIGDQVLVIGRDESADIRVDDRKVSRRHAAFKLVEDEVWVEDLGSSNGVRLNETKIDKRARVSQHDEIRVGGFRMFLKRVAGIDAQRPHTRPAGTLSVADVHPGTSVPEVAPGSGPRAEPGSGTASVPHRPRVIERGPPNNDLPRLVGLDPPARDRTFALQRGENIIGRLEECDVPILDGSVSRQHARVVFARHRVTVTDLGSSNGVFVNDLRIDMAELAEGDVLRVGNVAFSVRLPADLAVSEPAPLLTRARARKVTGDRRWLTYGAAGLGMAVVVLAIAFALQIQKGGLGRWVGAGFRGPGGMTATVGEALVGLGTRPGLLDEAPIVSPPMPGATDEWPVVTAPPPVRAEGVGAGADSTVSGDLAAPADRVASADPVAPESPVAPVGEAEASGPVEPLGAEGAADEVVNLVPTATSPYTRRGADGLPLNLPLVDPEFDLEGFIASTMAQAKACETESDFSCARARLDALLERDPINTEAKAFLDRIQKIEAAEAAMAEADRAVARGDYARALRALAEAPDDGPRADIVRQRADELKERAIDEELVQAAKEAKRRRSWRRAHRRFKYVLKLDPQSPVALEGLRALEQRMRRRKMAFAAYRPPSARRPTTTPGGDRDAIRRQFAGDDGLIEVAETYARGALDRAARRARVLAKRSSGGRAVTASAMVRAIAEVKKRYQRTRTEISNDPDQAWAMLIDLDRYERRILPRGTKSFVVRELEVSLSEAFAARGKVLFDRKRYEDAFQRWESGLKLDPTNPKVMAGLKRLEKEAEKKAQEAEIAGQRGEDDVCDRWKRITRMTRSEAPIHQRARKSAIATCR